MTVFLFQGNGTHVLLSTPFVYRVNACWKIYIVCISNSSEVIHTPYPPDDRSILDSFTNTASLNSKRAPSVILQRVAFCFSYHSPILYTLYPIQNRSTVDSITNTASATLNVLHLSLSRGWPGNSVLYYSPVLHTLYPLQL